MSVSKYEEMLSLRKQFDRSVLLRKAFNLPTEGKLTVKTIKPSGVSAELYAGKPKYIDKFIVQIVDEHGRVLAEMPRPEYIAVMGE